MSLRLETIAIGDELLTGKIADTNSAFVGQRLFSRGLRLERSTVILDDTPTIQQTLKARAAEADFIFCFGGLGPTTDDLTAKAVAELLGCELAEWEPARKNLYALFEKLGRTVTESSLKQVLYPSASEVIPNAVGLAPGFSCSMGKCRLYFLPGVPREMKAMVDATVLPDILKRAGLSSGDLLSHVWRLIGLPESELQTRLNGIQNALPPEAWLGYRTHTPENHLTLYYRSAGGKPSPVFEGLKTDIRAVVKTWCYAETLHDIEQVVVETLASRHLTLATAESCTGGLVGQRLTRIAGASQVIWGGANVYQIAAKRALLGVEVARESDAVSPDCTRRLAEAVKETSGCSLAVGVTGSLGPTAANDTDPIGTIYLCVVGDGAPPLEQRIVLPVRTREENQWGASAYALAAVLRWLESKK